MGYAFSDRGHRQGDHILVWSSVSELVHLNTVEKIKQTLPRTKSVSGCFIPSALNTKIFCWQWFLRHSLYFIPLSNPSGFLASTRTHWSCLYIFSVRKGSFCTSSNFIEAHTTLWKKNKHPPYTLLPVLTLPNLGNYNLITTVVGRINKTTLNEESQHLLLAEHCPNSSCFLERAVLGNRDEHTLSLVSVQPSSAQTQSTLHTNQWMR